MDIRLMFWVEGELVSKFLCEIVPQVGQIWSIPRGDHNLGNISAGHATVKVLLVEIHPGVDQIDIDIRAEYTEPFKPFEDRVRLSPGGFEK